MKTCEACGREFEWHRHQPLDCPWCGYDNSRNALPYSESYLKELDEKRRREAEERIRFWFEGDDEDPEED
jgi:hypothetical protein